MKKKFSLQRVLEIRERREQAMAASLAEARHLADLARANEALFVALRHQGESGRLGVPGTVPTVGQLQNTNYLLQRLDQQLEDARLAVRKADTKVEACMVDFGAATRDRQVLDRLKERQSEAAMLEEIDADRKTMDAVALSRYVRSDMSAEESGA